MERKSNKTCQCIPDYILQTMSSICKYILQNLNDRELKICKQVCSFWNEIVKEIMSERLKVISKKYPYSLLYESLHRPEVLLPFLKLEEENPQFIPEIMHGMSCSCAKLKLTTNYYLRFEEASAKLAACDLSSFKDMRSSKIVIFPLRSGIQINRYCISLNSIYDKIKKCNPYWKITDIINLPEKELKCSLWFINGSTEVNFRRIYRMYPSCPTGGLIINSGEDSICKIITFSGKNMESVSLRIQSKPYLTLSSSKERFKKLKKHYSIDPYKCTAFIFGNSPWKCNFPYILDAFEQTFPEVPLLFYTGDLSFSSAIEFSGKQFEISSKLSFPIFNFESSDAIIVLVWLK